MSQTSRQSIVRWAIGPTSSQTFTQVGSNGLNPEPEGISTETLAEGEGVTGVGMGGMGGVGDASTVIGWSNVLDSMIFVFMIEMLRSLSSKIGVAFFSRSTQQDTPIF